MFYAFRVYPASVLPKRKRRPEYIAAKLVFLTLPLLIAAPSASARDTLFTFDPEGPTACGTNENPAPSDTIFDKRAMQRGRDWDRA
jgi:hypothetical protein